ncbi:MAG: TraR/DksA C4-type zinc finger protein [Verrucomicrobia bacterium]|nr:TraR/DksA C4-type zinc finger protein [Verrucomicrobiota bacterium]
MATKKTNAKSAKKADKPNQPESSSPADSHSVSKPSSADSGAPRPGSSSRAASILGRPTAADRQRQAKERQEEYSSIDLSSIKSEWIKFFQKLLSIRAQISSQLSGLAKESAEEMSNYSLHMADSGTDNFDRDFNLSLMSSDQDTLYEIDEALKRIKNDTYGTCELTGKPIPKARLEAIPWTRFTIEAQAQLEKAGEVKTKRLGTLGTLEKSNSSMSGEGDDEESSGSSKSSKDKD